MKEGRYYEDIRDGQVLKCRTFTRSCYLFQRSNGDLIEREKTIHYKRVQVKRRLQHLKAVMTGTRRYQVTGRSALTS
ncbi:hypothetical protein [Bacillus sp. 1A]|uniref:hypothetical protein n=1 Tax=Bacillus sp. 1A TaxID=3461399 RepID=UPI004043AAEA